MASRSLQSTIEIAGVLSPSLQAAISNAVSRLDDMSKGVLESAGAAEKLNVEINTQEAVLQSLQKGYEDYVVSGQESSAEAQALANKIQQLSNELDSNKASLKAAEQAAKRLAETHEDSADAYTRLERTISGQQDELEALRREYANVVLEQGKTSAEAKQLENKISSLSGELNKNEQKLRDVGEAAEDAGRQAESSSEGYTVLKDVIANLATEAIEKAVEAFKELATEGDTALAMLEAKTGATASELEGFEDVMYEVYNGNYGDSLGDVSEALSTVIQMTDDLDNASLAKITKSAIALEDVFGFDTTESLRAVNSLMDQFGVTSVQAFNLIVQGAQKGLDQNGDLLDTINEYSVQFKNAGYSADDMFNMLANGAEAGTWSVDKLGDAVKEFNIRMSDGTANDYLKQLGVDVDSVIEKFNKGGPDAQAAIGTVMQAIMDCDDATLQYQAGVGLFGTMWEDLGADTVAALMDTQGAINSTADAMAKMDSAAYDTLESSLSQLGRTIKAEVVQPIGEKLIPVAKSAVNFVNSQVAPAVDWLLAHLPEVGIVLGSVGAVIAAMKWGSIVAQITKVIGAVKTFIAALAGISAPVYAVIAVVAVLALAFTNLWKNNEEFRDKITGIWEGIKGKFEEFGQTITDKLNSLGFDFANFGEVVGAIWDGFCSLLGPVFEGAFQLISDTLGFALDYISSAFDIFAGIFTGDWGMVWEGIKGVFGAVWDFIVNTFSNVLNTLKGLADVVLGWFGTSWEEVWSGISTFFSDTWNTITTVASTVWNAISSTASAIWGGITSFFSSAWEGVKTTFTNVWNSITSFLSTAWETIKNVVQTGVMFVGSILNAAFQIITLPFQLIWENCKGVVITAWEAIKSAVSTAIEAVSSVISTVTAAISDVISTVWNNIKSVTTTVWDSIKSVISTVWNAIKSAVSTAINAVKSTVSDIWNNIKSLTSTAWEGIKSAISTVWNAIKSAVSTAINAVKSNVSNVWNSVKSVTSSVWDGIKSAISNVWSGIKSGVSSAVNAVSSTVSSVWNSIKSTASSVWNGIKNAMIQPIEAARDKVKGVVDAIQGFFSSMSLKLPHIALPHFSVTGKLSIDPPSVPKLSISWYKDGGILTGATIFGAAGNTLLGGGEAGAEAVLPLSLLWDKMQTILQKAINGGNSTGESTDAIAPLSSLWNKLEGAFQKTRNTMAGAIKSETSTAWETLSSKASTIWGDIESVIGSNMDAAKKAVNAMKSESSTAWESIGSTVSSVLENIEKTLATGADAAESTTGNTSDAGLTSKAGELLAMDDFSLGSLSNGTSTVIYYDFSNFTWSPQIQTEGTGDDEDDFMARLRAHEAEFFDWLEEFIQMREVAQYA